MNYSFKIDIFQVCKMSIVSKFTEIMIKMLYKFSFVSSFILCVNS